MALTLLFPLFQAVRGVRESGRKLKAQLSKKGAAGCENYGAKGKNMDNEVLASTAKKSILDLIDGQAPLMAGPPGGG